MKDRLGYNPEESQFSDHEDEEVFENENDLRSKISSRKYSNVSRGENQGTSGIQCQKKQTIKELKDTLS